MRTKMFLHMHPWGKDLGSGDWLGLSNTRAHGYTNRDVHIKNRIALLRFLPGLRRIPIRIVAHEVQHAAGSPVERIHHDRKNYRGLTGQPIHECGMSTTIRKDDVDLGPRPEGRIAAFMWWVRSISWKTIFTYKHLSIWSIDAAKDLLWHGVAEVEPHDSSPLAKME